MSPSRAKKWDTLRRVAGYLRPYRSQMARLVPIMLAGTFAELLPPLIIQRIIDDVLTRGAGFAPLAWLVLGLLGARLMIWLSEVGRNWLSVWVAGRITADIRSQFHQHLQRLAPSFYDHWPVGTLMSRMTQDAGRMEEFLASGVPLLLSNGLMLIGILGFLFYTSWTLTLYVLLPVPLIVLGACLIWDRLMRAWGLQATRWSRLSTRLNESLSGIRVVKALSQEAQEVMRLDRHNDALLQANVQVERQSFTFFTVIYFLMGLGMLLAWYVGGRQVLRAQRTLGELLAVVSYLWMFYWPLQWLGQINHSMAQALTGSERIFEVLDTPAEAPQGPCAAPLPRAQGRVTFRKVTFGYDKRQPVLHEIDLDVAPGEMVGLVGKSGVGKTTAVNLINRFYDVDQGGIDIDGVDIRQVRLQDLRQQIGVVAQETFLFIGTIAENIGYSKPGASLEEIIAAAKAANAHTFIIGKPDGYDTEVGERGGRLSGGERQRIAIARAVLHDPKILILDEATSALDAQTEKSIQEALGRLAKSRTTFVIAHRLSTLKNADRVIVLGNGRVVEIGTHEELMARKGVFYNLVKTRETAGDVLRNGGERGGI